MAAKKQTPKTETTEQNNSDESQQSQDMVFLGGLWANRDKNGQIYFSGYLGSAKLLIFRNKNKTDKQPDYYMQLVNNKRGDSSVSSDDLEQEHDDIPF